MKKLNAPISSISSLFVLLLISCEPNNVAVNSVLEEPDSSKANFTSKLRSENQANDIEIQNNIVYFRSLEVFQRVRSNIDGELENFQKNYPDFKSKIDSYNSFNDEANSMTSKEELSKLLDKYKNSVELVGDEVKIKDESIYDFFIPDSKSPYFYIGKTINVYTRGIQYVIVDGDRGKVQKILNHEENIPNVAQMHINKSNKNLRGVESLCTNLYGTFTTYNNYKGESWCNVYAVGDLTGIILPNGQYQYSMYVATSTGGQVKRKIFGVWFNSDTDKTVYVSHNAYGYLDGSQVISANQNFSTTTYGTGENLVFSSHHPTPSPIWLAGNETYRFIANAETVSGRLSSSSLSGASVWYTCP